MKTLEEYYEILGVTKNASLEQIKKAYHKLAMEYHPDRYVGNPLAGLAEEKLKLINEAYKAVVDIKNKEYHSYSQANNQRSKQEYERNSYRPGKYNSCQFTPMEIEEARRLRNKHIWIWCVVGFIVGALAAGISVIVTVPIGYFIGKHIGEDKVKDKYGLKMITLIKALSN